MKKNTIKIVISLLVIALFAGGYLVYQNYFKGEQGAKAITITIEDETANKVLVDEKEFHTDAETLGDFLEENKNELQVVMDSSEYGRFIVGIEGIETEDMNKGPWWMYGYTSEAKDLDIAVGEAPGVDDIGLNDGDEFHFVFKVVEW